jgi:hypothetical protein
MNDLKEKLKKAFHEMMIAKLQYEKEIGRVYCREPDQSNPIILADYFDVKERQESWKMAKDKWLLLVDEAKELTGDEVNEMNDYIVSIIDEYHAGGDSNNA